MKIREALNLTLLLVALTAATPSLCAADASTHQAPAEGEGQPSLLELPHIRWSRSAGLIRLTIRPEHGAHFATDFPVEVRVRDGEALDLIWKEPVKATDSQVRVSLPLGRIQRPDSRLVSVRGAVCNQDASLCQPFLAREELRFPGPMHGTLAAQPGATEQASRPRAPPALPEPNSDKGEESDLAWFPLQKAGQWQAALDESIREPRLLLIKFSTQWCPPCTRLHDEFLKQPAYRPLLLRFVRVSADADHPSSFELKNRYQVGGYPSLLVVDAQGTLLERIVGFSTAQELEARLEALAPSGRAQDEAAQAVVAELRGMAARGEWAAGWDRVQSMTASRGGDEAVRFAVLSLALEFAEHVALEAAPELARRAAEIAPQPGLAAALIDRGARALRASAKNDEASQLEEDFGARLKAAIGARHTATPLISEDQTQLSGSVDIASLATQHDLANAAWYQGSWQGAEAGRELFATAALRSAAQILTDAGVDGSIAIALPSDLLAEDMQEKMVQQQGPIHDLISALKAAALFSVAIPICTQMTLALPEDFTWHYKLSVLLREAKEPAAALPSARLALKFSYGDNRLRAVAQLAEVLSDLEQLKEAKQLIEAELAAAPPAEQAIRTHRYRRRLQELMQTWHDTQRGNPR